MKGIGHRRRGGTSASARWCRGVALVVAVAGGLYGGLGCEVQPAERPATRDAAPAGPRTEPPPVPPPRPVDPVSRPSAPRPAVVPRDRAPRRSGILATEPPRCLQGPSDLWIFLFPEEARVGQPLRILMVSDTLETLGMVQVELEGTSLPIVTRPRVGGPPYAGELRVVPDRPGRLEVFVTHAETQQPSGCASREVLPAAVPTAPVPSGPEVWPVRRDWSLGSELLFSAWVAQLFHVPPGGQGGWFPLHQLTRDPARNWLHNVLGREEDDPRRAVTVLLRPDCGDLPYFLRAYFAWKLRLPFRFNRCTRGDEVRGPICPVARDQSTTRFAKLAHPVVRFNQFAYEWIGWGVHSGTVRTRADDDRADFYSVALSPQSLRPGRIFVDPAGHVFVVTQVEVGTPTQVGVLFAVDAHPDRTISRKRFAPGSFGFNPRVTTGGFKAFRPLRREGVGWRPFTNAELERDPQFGDFSLAQTRFTRRAQLFDAVQAVLNPHPLDPLALYRSKIVGVLEALHERVQAVEASLEHMQAAGWRTIHMPVGPAIFETEGPWESFSTPARDLRLLAALQDMLTYPDQVLRDKGRYLYPAAWDDARLRQALEAVYAEIAPWPLLTYVRSNGLPQSLSLADIVARREALQVAYNPNDCVERRWGAPVGSEEGRSCRRMARDDQRWRMEQYRDWFRRIRRPPAAPTN